MNESNPRPDVTFVGTGAIGLPMVERIHRAGFVVTAVEPGAAQRERVGLAGIPVVASLEEAPRSIVVIVMVATPGQLATVVDTALGKGRSGSLSRGQTWVIMSTVGPASVEAAAERLAAAGARVLDAPVTGGVAGARAGTLRIFCSGAAEHLDLVRPVLEACGVVEEVGSVVGRGQAVKVVNQHLCTVHLVAAAEALALARDLGLDPARVLDLVLPGAAGSWMLGDRGPRMLADAPQVTSTVGIFVKDSSLVEEAALTAGSDVPVLAAARARLLAADRAGLGMSDDSQVILAYPGAPVAGPA